MELDCSFYGRFAIEPSIGIATADCGRAETVSSASLGYRVVVINAVENL
jgi:hypothetical protein